MIYLSLTSHTARPFYFKMLGTRIYFFIYKICIKSPDNANYSDEIFKFAKN